jgi:hypothetical protein
MQVARQLLSLSYSNLQDADAYVAIGAKRSWSREVAGKKRSGGGWEAFFASALGQRWGRVVVFE